MMWQCTHCDTWHSDVVDCDCAASTAAYVDAYQKAGGKKFDDGKPRWDLMPFGAISQITDVITYGAKKYGANNWQALLSPDGRYFAACMRHLVAWRLGEHIDPESKCLHLAHAGCCILFMLSKYIGYDVQLDGPDVSK